MESVLVSVGSGPSGEYPTVLLLMGSGPSGEYPSIIFLVGIGPGGNVLVSLPIKWVVVLVKSVPVS